jgi:hypothetical protein
MFLVLKFLKPQLNLKSMMFDYEKAAMNASNIYFRQLTLKGVFSISSSPFGGI